jgi:hypothetical protein
MCPQPQGVLFCFFFFFVSDCTRKTHCSASSDSLQLLSRLRFESSRLAWAAEFFQCQPVLSSHTMSQSRNRRRSEDEAQRALANFLVRPWAPSLVLGQGVVCRAPQSYLVSFFSMAQGQTDSLAGLVLCCASWESQGLSMSSPPGSSKPASLGPQGAMVQWVRCLLCMRTRVISQNPHEKVRRGNMNPVPGKRRQQEPWR